MFKIIQSHRTERLLEHLLAAYQSPKQSLFEPFVVIVPSMILGDWLDKTIARRVGISTLVSTTFWGQYQWTVMQDVLTQHNAWLQTQHELGSYQDERLLNVPEVAVLSPTVMQWRIFGYLNFLQQQILADENHPLFALLSSLLEVNADTLPLDAQAAEQRLWQFAIDMARVFNRYLTHRSDWLKLWNDNKPLNIKAQIDEKDSLTQRFDDYAMLTPEWLAEHYVELEVAQRHLWYVLFSPVHQHRELIETRFWQALNSNQANVRAKLPNHLYLFTIQQLPETELKFLQRLSQYIDITLLHYNPSQMFWADIVDKQWLQRQQIIHPQNVYLKDYGHALLSRLGKQSRETFAMLASLSGNEDYDNLKIQWQDDFDGEDFESIESESIDKRGAEETTAGSILHRLQEDVLMLEAQATQLELAQKTVKEIGQSVGEQLNLLLDAEASSTDESNKAEDATFEQQPWYSDEVLSEKRPNADRHWQLTAYDDSLSIHACHSLQRQLEVLRGMIGRWLNESNADGSKRHLSDIVVMLPDLENHHQVIKSVFVDGLGQDGLVLPAKVTGVVDMTIHQLWEAISGFFRLLATDTARFEAHEVLDWLMLPPLYESLGLNFEQISRGCDLLLRAGFIRGFDEAHLAQTLDSQDADYRFSFAHALDRLVMGLIMPKVEMTGCLYPEPEQWLANAIQEKTLPYPAVSLADSDIIEALCRLHAGLNQHRDDHKKNKTAKQWIDHIETKIIHPMFGHLDQSRDMRAIFKAMNGFKSSLRANQHYQRYQNFQSAHGSQSFESNASEDNDSDNNSDIEAQLGQLQNLPLKLGFMLDSIETELANQQVSAEPTGVITFGRFGALRNVPFGLVVMLNMNLSEFPKRDIDNRYDLMKAGLARRGDRLSEDDDNGAFLDALLCAREACWIFYNGQSLTDAHEHLPANPVTELLQFLQGEVDWQLPELESKKDSQAVLAGQIKNSLPKLVESWLVTQHPALPFSKEVFVFKSKAADLDSGNGSDNYNDSAQQNKNEELNDWKELVDAAMLQNKRKQRQIYPPAPLWQSVYQQIKSRDIALANNSLISKSFLEKMRKVDVPSKEQIMAVAKLLSAFNESEHSTEYLLHQVDHGMTDILNDLPAKIDIQQLATQIVHPGKHFLKTQQVSVIEDGEQQERQEPLSLSPLARYQLNEQLLKSFVVKEDRATSKVADVPEASEMLLYDSIVPAGVARVSTLAEQQERLAAQADDFAVQLQSMGYLSEHVDNNVTIADVITTTHEATTTIEFNGLAIYDSAAYHLDTNDKEPKDKSAKAKMGLSKMAIQGMVPECPEAKVWLNMLPQTASPKHLMRYWLSHLFWQIDRKTTAAQVASGDGTSVWRYSKAPSADVVSVLKHYSDVVTFSLPPIELAQAKRELLKWVVYAQISAGLPMVILPRYAFIYLQQSLDAVKENKSLDSVPYVPKKKDYSHWVTAQRFGSNGIVYDSCSQHDIWAYILGDEDAFFVLKQNLMALAQPLFGCAFKSLSPVRETSK